uniref:RNase NYN domain-containing protein n=1 Tax=Ditylenchus dipsaci TaxID=166011 RepID=A0A915D9S3_9BILA
MPPKRGKRDSKAGVLASSTKQTPIHHYMVTKNKTAEENNSIRGLAGGAAKGGRRKCNSVPEATDPTPCKRSKSSSITSQPSASDSSISCSTPKTKLSTSMESVQLQTRRGCVVQSLHDQALLDEGELTEKELQADFSDGELNMEITEDERTRMTEQELEEYEKQKEQMKFANELLGLDTVQLIRESDMLNIKFDREEFTNLCRLPEIALVAEDSGYSRLGSVLLSELDLIFITDPGCSYRDVMVYSFCSKYSSENRCVVDCDAVISLFHFIAQAPSNSPLLPTSQKRMFKASENLLQSVGVMKNYGSLEERQELCRKNIELFCCSIIPCLDFAAWRTRFTTSILRNLCQVYLDVVAVRLKAKLSAAFEMIVNSLPDAKKVRVLNEFCVKLSKLILESSAFLSGMRSILAMLSRFRFFDAYRMSEQTDFYEEQKITMMDAFNLVPKVVELIADKPTDLYVTMQLLNTCTVDSMLKEQNLKTLMTLQDRMNVAKMHMKTTIRLDDRIIESLCDAPHRIQMVMNSKRQAMVYGSADMDSTISSDENDEDGDSARIEYMCSWQPISNNGKARSRRKKKAEALLIASTAEAASSSKYETDDDDQWGIAISDKPIKRVAVIDACNVMHTCSGLSLNSDPTLKHYDRNADAIGLLVLIHKMLSDGYDIRVFVPMSYMEQWKVDNFYILERLHNLGLLQLVEYRVHDDLKILQTAQQLDGFVISNDKFYDYVLRTDGNYLLDVIRDRIVPFVPAKVVLENGLEAMSSRDMRFFTGFNIELKPAHPKAMVVESGDDVFDVIFFQQVTFKNAHKMVKEKLQEVELLFDYLQQNFCNFLKIRAPKLPYFNPKFQVLPRYFRDFYKLYEKTKLTEESFSLIWKEDKDEKTKDSTTQSTKGITTTKESEAKNYKILPSL